MRANVGIVICNYNKKEYLVSCIESILELDYQDFEIYVVDNASTDGAPELVTKRFDSKINLLINSKNLGGAGGFNRGLEEAIKGGHRYILLLDNDVRLDKRVLDVLLENMESDESIAVTGSAIYKMDSPNQLQEMGAMIDWEKFEVAPLYKDVMSPCNLPELIECDYVPACCALVRTEAIFKVGLMDSSLFIHWDDIEWCYKFKKSGFKVTACSNAKVWHKAGIGFHDTTFPQYYLSRNKVNFFMRYLDKDKLPALAEWMVTNWSKALYFGSLKGIHSVANTLFMAYEDALNGMLGEATENRIFKRESSTKDLLSLYINGSTQIIAIADCSININDDRIRIYARDKEIDYQLVYVNVSDINRQLAHIHKEVNENTFIVYLSTHILETPAEVSGLVVVDEYLNVVDLRDNKDQINQIIILLSYMRSTMGLLYTERLLQCRRVFENTK
ncbi:glycosyltransferase family 2 protein [Ammoniphilus sp. CFH 90114]|uniref:glycosyltransferase family 2 protein n=1 Tax=Ammoniphilus sp. CFH 90114 TaxID=2493665 RepID=UPI00100EAE97|nr:glycosyltransferase family 2 protein [Ammoniphilus sp. CFH 90114]RXT04468.1 glycosyltransferase family 2 protein [Ammoniphilus sp. CFH 90114]